MTPTLALGFHELATNAAKYWALSNPTGRLWFTSRVGSGERGEELRLTWQEQGGSDVQPPEALGFGMTVLSRTIEYQHSGKVELDGRREGLVCRLVLPLSKSSAAKRSNSRGTEAAVGTFIRMQGPPCAARSAPIGAVLPVMTEGWRAPRVTSRRA